MKNLTFILLLLISSLTFGQTVEPAIPEVFSQLNNCRDFTMSEQGDEIYFTLFSPADEISVLGYAKKGKKKWSKPEIFPYSGSFKDIEPSLSPDGLKLLFASNRPISDTSSQAKDFDIWYSVRENKNSAWSKPINMGAPINSNLDEFYPSLASNGNLYFTSVRPQAKGKDDIYVSVWKDNVYSQAQLLSDSINTMGYEFNAYIAPDESFIIFGGYNRPDGFGSGDLYISYKNEDNTWSQAKNLGDKVNSKYLDYCPFLDLSTKTLYFTSKRSSVKSKNFDSIDQYFTEINKYDNGLSRIYKIRIADLLK